MKKEKAARMGGKSASYQQVTSKLPASYRQVTGNPHSQSGKQYGRNSVGRRGGNP